jgi:hypothetical protein
MQWLVETPFHALRALAGLLDPDRAREGASRGLENPR